MASALLKQRAMRGFNRLFVLPVVAGCLFAASASAVTLAELRNAPKMTPELFASYFKDFEFKFHDDVQDFNVFLRTRSGDCDDYATLAADVLSRHGYTPRLVAVRMEGETHVVCYIVETRSYLDYNFRNSSTPLIPSDGSLTDIARKVSQSFNRGWLATYEFTYSDTERVKRLVNNILHNRTRRTS
jgi:hypothetical protein